MYRSMIKNDSEIAAQLSGVKSKSLAALSNDIFKKDYDQITNAELQSFVEDLISSLYVLRKNLPFNFNHVLRLAFFHPNLNIIDRNVSLKESLPGFRAFPVRLIRT